MDRTFYRADPGNLLLGLFLGDRAKSDKVNITCLTTGTQNFNFHVGINKEIAAVANKVIAIVA
jgi:hypothetical protein